MDKLSTDMAIKMANQMVYGKAGISMSDSRIRLSTRWVIWSQRTVSRLSMVVATIYFMMK